MHKSAAFFVILLASSFAHALPLTLDNVSGQWSNSVGAPATYLVVGNEAQVRWGGDGGSGQSGLGFLGNQALPLGLVPAQDFELGTLTHYNNPVFPPAVNSTDLAVKLAFHQIVANESFRFTFKIDETPNVPPCPYPGITPCSDKIILPSTFAVENFQYAGRVLTLQVLGFRTTPNGPAVTEFISEEHSTNSAVLVGRLRVLTGGCTYTQGYWKNHSNAWPVTQLSLGQRTYSQNDLLRILGTPVRGNGLVSLAHQLIAAKLSRAAFAGTSDMVEAEIAAADGLIGALVVPPVGTGSLSSGLTSTLEGELDSFNNGAAGTPHCN